VSDSVPGQVGNASVEETWTRLQNAERSVLIDVRTRAEWSFVGLPDLGAIGKRVLLVEWQSFPDSQPNEAFVTQLKSELDTLGADRTWEIYFLCRSGVRSLNAAKAMAAEGYGRCFNVANGFEGPLDSERHRGSTAGWKAAGLPWGQG